MTDATAAGRSPGLPPGRRVVWSERAGLLAGGGFATGGSPWRLVHLSRQVRDFVVRLAGAGERGLLPEDELQLAVANLLIERGLAHPVVEPRPLGLEIVVIVPARDRPQLLDTCLAGLADIETIVVDDGSRDPDAVQRVVADRGARLIRHETTRGPAAARNSGLAATRAPVVAFLDSDCAPEPGWLQGLVPHLDDPRVAMVAPRIRPQAAGDSRLARFEAVSSALDMGRRRELVRPGSALAFVPSAALVARRRALGRRAFEPSMRVGEDVDLVWRLTTAGWHVRYEPAVTVRHEMRLRPSRWVGRRFVYGTSAADLDRRHPGRLPPAHVSAASVLTVGLTLLGHPRLGSAVAAAATVRLGRRLAGRDAPPWLAPALVGRTLVADTGAVGRLLRREWWPLGWLALLTGRRSILGATAGWAMLAPLLLDYARERPDLDPLTYLLLRLAGDAAYGSGVLANAVRSRRPSVVLPRVSRPAPPARG